MVSRWARRARQHLACLGCFRGLDWHVDVCPKAGGQACGETFLLTWLLGVSRGDTWLFLPYLVEVWDVGACVVRLGSHVVAPVFCELLCLGGCVPRVASALCLTPLVLRESFPAALAGKGLVIPTEPCSRGSPPYSLQVASFPVGFKCELQESVVVVSGCACCERGCWFAHAAVGFVVSLRILWSALCWLVVNSGEVLPEFFSVGSGGKWFAIVLSGVLVVLVEALSGPACVASAVLLAIVFLSDGLCCWPFGLCVLVKVLPRIAPLLILAKVLPRSAWTALSAFGGGVVPLTVCLAVVLARLSPCFIFLFLGCASGTSCVPMVGWFASLLVLYVLSQMVVWSLPLSCLEVELVAPLVRIWQRAMCLVCALEAPIAIGHVALSTCGESLPVGFESFQATGFGASVACSALFGLRLLAGGFLQPYRWYARLWSWLVPTLSPVCVWRVYYQLFIDSPLCVALASLEADGGVSCRFVW
ncbi:hypothetical protein Taro_046859 [Colocasia esculenta]|uniref:Uncharacterized protein n=1 Tax=Colocasia esculenta TaxID=4460 RepID=A0A843X4P5_COLES|nr:hypothetical protein [Colocasia esculenta]